ncbi:MAG: acyclic terpene utilization AtuA family protein [Planctomycetaceae bacterium]|nr:acyclic terpene utilization AtuA family protein [Planctomycetaceae bacterium]
MPSNSNVLRIANCSGFYGDRLAAAREMLEGGEIDFLTGDYLAELTMMILWKLRQKDANRGYATTFLKQMEDVLGLALERGVKIVTNAGGLNPAGLANELRALAAKLGLHPKIAHLEGDNLLDKLPALQAAGHPLKHLDRGVPLSELSGMIVSANAYLGAWGIVEALNQGANVVICPRVTDASVVVGPAAWHFGWKRDAWDQLAGAVIAGHVVECGTQCTGGNYAFFREVPGLEHPGFPIAEMRADGSSVITKHPDTGGLVSVGTVSAQLLYEIDGPAYFNPDVVARFDSIRLQQLGPDRVEISGVKGDPAPATIKVCINYLGGFRNSMTFVLTGLDIEAKAALARETLTKALGGGQQLDALEFELIRSDKPDPQTNTEACALLRATAKSQNPQLVGRPFSNAAVEMALASYPGFYLTTPPGEANPYGVYWPALVPATEVEHWVVSEEGSRTAVPHTKSQNDVSDAANAAAAVQQSPAVDSVGKTRKVPLGTLIGARSGDKGGNANVGLWANDEAAYRWLAGFLTVDRFRELMPEAAGLAIRRYELPNMRSLNFVVVGLLGEGVSSSTRYDPQAKGLGEFLRAKLVEIPEALLDSGK